MELYFKLLLKRNISKKRASLLLACVTGARKGKGGGKIGRDTFMSEGMFQMFFIHLHFTNK